MNAHATSKGTYKRRRAVALLSRRLMTIFVIAFVLFESRFCCRGDGLRWLPLAPDGGGVVLPFGTRENAGRALLAGRVAALAKPPLSSTTARFVSLAST